MRDFDRLMNSVIAPADPQGDPEAEHQLNAFVRDNPRLAAEAIVSFARVRLEAGQDAFRDVETVLWSLIVNESAVLLIESALSADVVLAERLFRSFAIVCDERKAIPAALATRLVQQWLKRDTGDDDGNDRPNLLSSIRKRDPERAWSILADCWSSPDRSDSTYSGWLLIATVGHEDEEEWAAKDTWPRDVDWRDYFPADDPRRVRAAVEAASVDHAVRSWIAQGRDPAIWLWLLGEALPGCGHPGCCRPGLFELELEDRGYGLRRRERPGS